MEQITAVLLKMQALLETTENTVTDKQIKAPNKSIESLLTNCLNSIFTLNSIDLIDVRI